jgi:hypothetical protein
MRCSNRFLRSGVALILILTGVGVFVPSLAHAQEAKYVMRISVRCDGPFDPLPSGEKLGSYQYTGVPAYVTFSGYILTGNGKDPTGRLFTINGTFDQLGGVGDGNLEFSTGGPGLGIPGLWNGAAYSGYKQGNTVTGQLSAGAWPVPAPCADMPFPEYQCTGIYLYPPGTFTATFEPYGVVVGDGGLVEGDMAVVGRSVGQGGVYYKWEDESIPLVAGQDAEILLKITAKLVPEASRTILVEAWFDSQDAKDSKEVTLGEQAGTPEGQELEVTLKLRPRKPGSDRLWAKAESENTMSFERNHENNQVSVSVSVARNPKQGIPFLFLLE